jgi:hypothetical protein
MCCEVLLILGFFNDAFRTAQETVVIYSKVRFQHLPGVTKENHEHTEFGITFCEPRLESETV